MIDYARLSQFCPHHISPPPLSPPFFHSVCPVPHHVQSRPYAPSLGILSLGDESLTTTLPWHFLQFFRMSLAKTLNKISLFFLMCFSTYQGCIKDKLNIQTRKTSLSYTWHPTDLEGCETGNSIPAEHHEASFFKGRSCRSLLSC